MTAECSAARNRGSQLPAVAVPFSWRARRRVKECVFAMICFRLAAPLD
jgi:hypothetical protein